MSLHGEPQLVNQSIDLLGMDRGSEYTSISRRMLRLELPKSQFLPTIQMHVYSALIKLLGYLLYYNFTR